MRKLKDVGNAAISKYMGYDADFYDMDKIHPVLQQIRNEGYEVLVQQGSCVIQTPEKIVAIQAGWDTTIHPIFRAAMEFLSTVKGYEL